MTSFVNSSTRNLNFPTNVIEITLTFFVNYICKLSGIHTKQFAKIKHHQTCCIKKNREPHDFFFPGGPKKAFSSWNLGISSPEETKTADRLCFQGMASCLGRA